MKGKMPIANVPTDLVGAMKATVIPAPDQSPSPMLEGAASPATPDAGGQNVQPTLPKEDTENKTEELTQ